jgi:hypothetical protein
MMIFVSSSGSGSISESANGLIATSKSIDSSQSVGNFLPDFRVFRFIARCDLAPDIGLARLFDCLPDDPCEQGLREYRQNGAEVEQLCSVRRTRLSAF